ncbi:hypothetical protein Tco_1267447 [Tanacetum coccineum]
MNYSHSSARSSVSQNSVFSDVVVESYVPSGTVVNAFIEEIVAYEKEIDETHAVKSCENLSVKRPTHSGIFNSPIERSIFIGGSALTINMIL